MLPETSKARIDGALLAGDGEHRLGPRHRHHQQHDAGKDERRRDISEQLGGTARRTQRAKAREPPSPTLLEDHVSGGQQRHPQEQEQHPWPQE